VSDSIQVVIVDDHPLFREGVVTALNSQPDIRVAAEGDTAADAVALATELLPDVLLLDISLPGNGLQAVSSISAACPITRIVMLTASEDEDDVTTALKAGARGYIVKGVSGRELVAIVRAVHAGDVYVTPSLASSLLFHLAGQARQTADGGKPLDELTERERQILELVADGQSNREVGEALAITEKTVKHHMTNILQKLQLRNRVEAALWARRARQDDPPRSG
jgi:DNA-binding NarL/FixJ family response regulator